MFNKHWILVEFTLIPGLYNYRISILRNVDSTLNLTFNKRLKDVELNLFRKLIFDIDVDSTLQNVQWTATQHLINVTQRLYNV